MNFIFLKGKTETLEFFSARLADALAARGFEVYTHDFYGGEALLTPHIKGSETVLITFNCIGLSGEQEYMMDGGSLWKLCGVRIINILVDHPMYYHNQLSDTEKFAGEAESVHTVCIDRFHAEYVRKFYPEIKNVHFAVLAGSGAQYRIPFEQKKYDVIFTGNFTPCSHFERFINANGPEYAAFYRGIIDDLLSDPSRPVETVCIEHIKREAPKASNGELRFTVSKFLFIDLYVRFYLRERAIAALSDAGVDIKLIGHGFEALKTKSGRVLSGKTLLPTAHCLEETARARISLNIMPGFCDGGHDRILSSMLCGTLSLTDRSIWLSENFTDLEDICFYDIMQTQKLPETVFKLLDDTALLCEITENGRKKALEAHTWDSRAAQLLKFL